MTTVDVYEPRGTLYLVRDSTDENVTVSII